MPNLTQRLMSEATGRMLAAVLAKQKGNQAKADWDRFLAHLFYAIAQSPDAIARLDLKMPSRS